MSKKEGGYLVGCEGAQCINLFRKLILGARRKSKLFFYFFLIVGLTFNALAQYQIRFYSREDGLGGRHCQRVILAYDKSIAVIHPLERKLSLLDGYTIRSVPLPQVDYYKIYLGLSGQIWVSSFSKLYSYDGEQWSDCSLTLGGSYYDVSPTLMLRGMIPLDTNGGVLLVYPNEIFTFNPNHSLSRKIASAEEIGLGEFRDVAHDFNNWWILCTGGLIKIEPGNLTNTTKWQKFAIPSEFVLTNLFQLQIGINGRLVMLSDSLDGHTRYLVEFNGKDWQVFQLPLNGIRVAWPHTEQNLWWIMTPTQLMVFDGHRAWSTSEQISGPFIDTVSTPEGSFYICTDRGLWHAQPSLWCPIFIESEFKGPVFKALKAPDNKMWIISEDGLYRLDLATSNKWDRISWPDGLQCDSPERIELVGFEDGTVLWSLKGKIGFVTSTLNVGLLQNLGGYATILGRKESIVLLALKKGEEFEILELDRSLVPHKSTFPALPVLWGEPLFTTQLGDALLMCTAHALLILTNGSWHEFCKLPEWIGIPRSIGVLEAGKIYLGADVGILEFTPQSGWIGHPLLNFRIYDIKVDGSNIWFASSGGVGRLEGEQWFIYDTNDGITALPIYTFVKGEDRMMVGTFRGLAEFRAFVDCDPPIAFRPRIEIFDRSGNTFTLIVHFTGKDRWDHTPSDRLFFSYKVDNGPWSVFRDRPSSVALKLLPGIHKIEVKAMDKAGNIQTNSLVAEIELFLPWYAETRFRWVLILTSVAVLGSIALAINRHLELKRSYRQIEQIVEKRTYELEQAMEALLHSRKMTALGTLAAGIAHEFNNLLSVIRGFAQLLISKSYDHQKVKSLTERIIQACDQAEAIVNDLLVFSRPGNEKIEACEISEIIKQTINIISPQFGQDIKFEVHVSGAIPKVYAIPDRARQVFLNLIINAAEAMERKGTIHIKIEQIDHLPQNLYLKPANAPYYVAVSVEDSGCGIPPEIIDRIFEPFFTTKAYSAHKGTGLGLFTVYQFVSQMQGGISVESKVACGTKFTVIFLPVMS